jgi:exoribonuclease R
MSSRQPFDLVAAARRSMTERGFTPDYPPQVLQELAALQADPPKTNPAAEDLQHLLWSSIDNDTSRDLDQIEYSEMLPDGHTRVLIGVADVDRYVAKGSAIDQLRGPGNGHHLQWREELLHASGGALDRAHLSA